MISGDWYGPHADDFPHLQECGQKLIRITLISAIYYYGILENNHLGEKGESITPRTTYCATDTAVVSKYFELMSTKTFFPFYNGLAVEPV